MIDDRELRELTTGPRSCRPTPPVTKATLPDLAGLAADRRGHLPDAAEVEAFNLSRRGLLSRLGLTGAGLATKGLWAGGIGTALVGILGRPASAQQNLDVQMLNTASSLENLGVATYQAALGLDFIKNGNKTIVALAQTTMKQHAEHGAAFNAQAKSLGGKEQTQPNPKFAAVVEQAKPTLKSPLDLVKLAASLEEVASDTYLDNLTKFGDKKSKEIMGSVMVEVQHLATLKAVEVAAHGQRRVAGCRADRSGQAPSGCRQRGLRRRRVPHPQRGPHLAAYDVHRAEVMGRCERRPASSPSAVSSRRS